MRFTSLRLRGIGPYRDEVAVDFDALPGPLIAVCGANGAGKSIILEALLGAVWRTTKTRGHLKALATSRESFVEAALVINGAAYTIRQTVDQHTGAGETLIMDAAGRPMNETGKTKEGKRWVQRYCPDQAVYLASLFGAQKVGGLLSMDPADRKKVIGRALGNTRYEQLAEAAGKHAKSWDAEVRDLYARLDEIGAGGGAAERVARMTTAFAAATTQLQGAEHRRARADSALVAARQAAADAQAARSAWREREGRRADVARRLATLEQEAKLTAQRIENNRLVMARAPEIRAAKAKLDGLRDSKVVVDRDVTAVGSALTAAELELERMIEASAAAERRRLAAEARIRRAQSVQATAQEVEEAARAIKRAEKELSDLHRRRSEVEEQLRQARELERTSQLRRIVSMRTELAGIAEDAQAPATHGAASKALRGIFDRASRALSTDDDLAEQANRAPKQIAEAEGTEREIRREVDAATQQLAALRITAARKSTIDEAAAEEARATAEQLAAGAEMAAAEARRTELEHQIPELREQQQEARKAQREIADQVGPLDADAKLFERMTAAEGRLAELEPLAARLADEMAKARAELAALPTEPEPAMVDVSPAQRAYGAAAAEVEAGQQALAKARAELEQARQAAERERELVAQRDAAAVQLADWKLLATSLGRDGIQALELDAAGPELTRLTNEFLRCKDARFTVRLDSTRRLADGRDVEGCPIMVYDAHNGREGEAKTFSPGEQAFIGEALDLALSLYGIQRLGGEEPTIIRDEPTSTMDPDNGRVYVAMLRRAAALTRAHRILFVTHDRSLWPLADARIHIANGKVTVD